MKDGFFIRVWDRLFVIDAHLWPLLFSRDMEILFAYILGFIFCHEEEKKWVKVELWFISTRNARNIVLPLMPPIFLLISSFFLMILSSFL